VGWAIGAGEEYPESQEDMQDQIESQALYNLLEQDIIPTYYDRARDGVPHEWLLKIKTAFKRLAPFFNTDRMVQEYTAQMYMPAWERETALSEPSIQAGLDFAAWMSNLQRAWQGVAIRSVDVATGQITVGTALDVTAEVSLGELKPEDVQVQLYYGTLGRNSEIADGADCVVMNLTGPTGAGTYRYQAQIAHHTSGERGLSVRALPNNPYLPSPFVPGVIRWANG
jgi:starch phosphorylase